jgi:cobalt-precorrin-7 (C5)-methyltransferase
VEVHVVAGVSAVQACAARLGMRWDQAVLFTFHDGATPVMKEELAAAVKAGKEVLLLPEPKAFAPNHIAGFLLDSGVDKKTPVAVCENVTLDSEKVTETTLQEALGLSFGSLCVMVIKNEEKQKRVE